LNRLLPSLALLTALASGARAAEVVSLEWCSPSAPVKWGFGFTPADAAKGVHLRVASKSVLLTGAHGGPGLPADWTVTLASEKEAVASGTTPLPAGTPVSGLFLLESDRSVAGVDSRGVLPVEWEAWCVDGAGQRTPSGIAKASFPPVLELQDAAARGLVLVTIEGVGPNGPIEVTVDNPTWLPLWLDLPTGSALSVDGKDWIVGISPPFRMMRRQKTGMTVTAFPLDPVSGLAVPRRLNWGRRTHDASPIVRDLALGVEELRRKARMGERQSGDLERAEPFDFWPLVLKWATWKSVGKARPDLLQLSVARLLAERARQGDTLAGTIAAESAAAEIDGVAASLGNAVEVLKQAAIPLDQQAIQARFD
jgi:hypothetical protein